MRARSPLAGCASASGGRVALSTWLYAWVLAASLAASAADDFRFYPRALTIPERGEVVSYVLVLGTNQYSLLPPAGWQLRFEAKEKRCTLTSPDLGAGMTFRVTAATNQEPTLNKDALRQALIGQHPKAQIVREQPIVVGDIEGLAFDLEQPAGNRERITTRVAFGAFPGGIVEFSLTSSSAKLGSYARSFRNFITSFELDASQVGRGGPAKD